MTEEDSNPDEDGQDEPASPGGFRFGMTDGSGDGRSGRDDDAETGIGARIGELLPWTDDGSGGSGGGRERTSDRTFGGFSFTSWLSDSVSGSGSETATAGATDTVATGDQETAEEPVGATDHEPVDERVETAATAPATVDHSDFAGFDFVSWLEDSPPSEPTEPAETEAEEPATTAAAAGAGVGTDEEPAEEPTAADADEPPAEEPATAAAAGTGKDTGEPAADEREPATAGAAAGAATYGGFRFTEWLRSGDTEYIEPAGTEVEPAGSTDEPEDVTATGAVPTESTGSAVATGTVASTGTDTGPTATGDLVSDEDESEAVAAGAAGGGGGGGFPSPPSGGLGDTPPLKLAMIALFTAAIVVVALTLAGTLAPLGPGGGFAGTGDDGNQAAGTTTPTPTDESTPTAEDDETPTATDESTATATDESTPTATEESTPTATAEPTATPTDEPTPTPTDDSPLPGLPGEDDDPLGDGDGGDDEDDDDGVGGITDIIPG